MQETRASCQHPSDSLIISNIQDKNMFQWGQAAYPLDEQAEPLTRILEHEGRTCFKAFMALKECLREETRQVLPFAYVYADIQGFIQELRNGFDLRTLGSSFCHGSSLRSWRPTPIRMETRCGWRGPSPWRCRSHRLPRGSLRSPQTYQGFPTPPPLRVKGSVPTMSKGVFRLLSWKSDPQVTSPLSIVHELLFKIKNDSGSLCQEPKPGKEEKR